MSTTNQNTFIDAFNTLAPTTRWLLKVSMAVGGISILYYLGYFSFKGIGILTMVLLACSLIVMSASSAELETRQATMSKLTALWNLITASFAEMIAANANQQQQQQQSKTA
jgi:uncharacterized oligopeptide transporter (OPT) family protein